MSASRRSSLRTVLKTGRCAGFRGRGCVSRSIMRALFLCSLLVLCLPAAAAEKCPVPKSLTFVVDSELRRDTPGFTEGLEVHDGTLYESTGNFFGESGRVAPQFA